MLLASLGDTTFLINYGRPHLKRNKIKRQLAIHPLRQSRIPIAVIVRFQQSGFVLAVNDALQPFVSGTRSLIGSNEEKTLRFRSGWEQRLHDGGSGQVGVGILRRIVCGTCHWSSRCGIG
jgi:hypothetical protein